MDTGVNWQHPDLIGNLWMNEVEMNGPGATAANGYQNGIDDDNDGKRQWFCSAFMCYKHKIVPLYEVLSRMTGSCHCLPAWIITSKVTVEVLQRDAVHG